MENQSTIPYIIIYRSIPIQNRFITKASFCVGVLKYGPMLITTTMMTNVTNYDDKDEDDEVDDKCDYDEGDVHDDDDGVGGELSMLTFVATRG